MVNITNQSGGFFDCASSRSEPSGFVFSDGMKVADVLNKFGDVDVFYGIRAGISKASHDVTTPAPAPVIPLSRLSPNAPPLSKRHAPVNAAKLGVSSLRNELVYRASVVFPASSRRVFAAPKFYKRFKVTPKLRLKLCAALLSPHSLNIGKNGKSFHGPNFSSAFDASNAELRQDLPNALSSDSKSVANLLQSHSIAVHLRKRFVTVEDALSRHLCSFPLRRRLGFQNAARQDLNLVLPRERDARLLPLGHRRLRDSKRIASLGLRPEVLHQFIEGHGPLSDNRFRFVNGGPLVRRVKCENDLRE